MPHRRFVDEERRRWTVWDVHPSSIERRMGLERRRTTRPGDDRRLASDRRRMRLDPNLRSGWLCFECRDERRRLVPIPAGWDRLPACELGALCRRASRVRRSALPPRENPNDEVITR